MATTLTKQKWHHIKTKQKKWIRMPITKSEAICTIVFPFCSHAHRHKWNYGINEFSFCCFHLFVDGTCKYLNTFEKKKKKKKQRIIIIIRYFVVIASKLLSNVKCFMIFISCAIYDRPTDLFEWMLFFFSLCVFYFFPFLFLFSQWQW